MTDSFQSTAFNSSRTPVSTFVSPVRVQPKTNLMALAKTMAEINPTLQKFVNLQIEKEKQKGIQEGQLQVLGSNPEGIKDLKKQLEKNEGKRFARNFVGGNIYTQYGIEKQLAINLGNASEAKTAAFFKNYTVNGIPLSEFDINSNEFKQAINEFNETSLLNTRGIRPELVNQFFLPKQNAAITKFYNDHQNNLAEAKLNQAAILLEPAILNSWLRIDTINEQIDANIINNDGFTDGYNYSLNELQKTVDDYVERGLSSLVSPAKLLGYMETNILKIFEYYEDNDLDMEEAYEEIEEYVDWISGLKVGPAKQDLSNFFIQDGENKVETILDGIFEKKEQVIANKIKFEKKNNERKILNTLNNTDFNKTDFNSVEEEIKYYKDLGQTLKNLSTEFPNQIQFLYEQYDLRNFNVDEFFIDLKAQYDQGEKSQIETLNKLNDVMLALGPNASGTDKQAAEDLKKYINETQGKSLTQRFPEISNLQSYANKRLGKLKDGVYVISKGKNNHLDKLTDLNREFERLVKENNGVMVPVTVNNKNYKSIKDWYLDNVRDIESNDYEFYDQSYNFDREIELIQKEETNNNNERTINIEEQKILTYDTETKLFNEVNPSELQIGSNTTVVSMNGSITPAGQQILKELNIDSLDNFNVNRYNTKIENEQILNKNQNLREDDLSLKSNTNQFEAGAFSEGGFTTFEIKSGDTLSAISEDFGIPMEAIMKANGITNANQIDIGDVLLIPEGVDYTDLNNINFIENLDKTKLITEKEHPYAPVREKHNFQVIYNIAKEIGIKYPELVAAQAMEETGYGETQSAKNNFLGLQATSSEVKRGESERKLTTEFRGQGEQIEEANFKTFDNIKEMMMQYKKQWNDNFKTKSYSRKGIVNASSIQEAIKMLQAEDYATNPDYDKHVLDIIDRAIKEGWF